MDSSPSNFYRCIPMAKKAFASTDKACWKKRWKMFPFAQRPTSWMQKNRKVINECIHHIWLTRSRCSNPCKGKIHSVSHVCIIYRLRFMVSITCNVSQYLIWKLCKKKKIGNMSEEKKDLAWLRLIHFNMFCAIEQRKRHSLSNTSSNQCTTDAQNIMI